MYNVEFYKLKLKIVFFGSPLETNASIGARHVINELIAVFADEGFFMVARDVMPSDAVIVDVVEDTHAGFVSSVDVKFSVIWLPDFLVSRRAPRVVAESVGGLVGRCHLPAGC